MRGILPILGLIFVTLKLCGLIDWSWWWVLSPFLAVVAIVAAVVVANIIFLPQGHWWR